MYQHGYDEMGRPKTMIDAGTQTTIVGSATYGPAGELLTMGNETRQYNSRLQVTRITYPTQDWEYKYSATQNNGQITAMKDWTSGEEVNYAYDELKRLASAVTVGPEWGNSYVYDGFGNLLQKNVVKGTAPYMNLSIDPATNKPYSGYSAAGLPTVGAGFDNDNRMIATTAGSSYQEYYAYSPAGKRVWNRGKRDIGGTWVDKEEVWFWGVTGQRMAFYSLTASGNPVFTLTSTNLYMGSKLVMSGGAAVKTDRLGSVGKFYPWGEERTPTGVSGEKFATYYHDVQAAMNYADQRWHGTNGRFQVPDPYRKSATSERPSSWNRFSYVLGDPIRLRDRRGLDAEDGDSEDYEPETCRIVSEDGGDSREILGSCEVHQARQKGRSTSAQTRAERLEAERAAWARVKGSLANAASEIRRLRSLPEPCVEALGKLGVTLGQIKGAAANVVFLNGAESSDKIGSLFANNPAEGSLAATEGYNPNQSISSYMLEHDSSALSELGGPLAPGNSVYVMPSHIVGWSTYSTQGLVLHELLHNLGLVDTKIQTTLGLDPSAPSRNITDRLTFLCF